MTPEPRVEQRVHPGVGLCSVCRHARIIGNRRGSSFHLCTRARTDPRFRKYPPLPVYRCAGFEAGTPEDSRVEASPNDVDPGC